MFLQTVGEEKTLGNEHFTTAVRRRLLIAEPVPEWGNKCNHRNKDGICGAFMGADHGRHACSCKLGGGIVERHDDVKNEVAEWLRTEVNIKCKTEQVIPEWGRINTTTNAWEDAKLDIIYNDERGARICLDVAVVDGSETVGNSKTALSRREANKHRRYPAANLFPFVVDTRGKWGNEALAWTKAVLKNVDPEEKGKLVRSLRVRVSVALQRSVADLMICATKEIRTRNRS